MSAHSRFAGKVGIMCSSIHMYTILIFLYVICIYNSGVHTGPHFTQCSIPHSSVLHGPNVVLPVLPSLVAYY